MIVLEENIVKQLEKIGIQNVLSVRRQGVVFHCNKLDLSRTKELFFVEHALKETLHMNAQNAHRKLLG